MPANSIASKTVLAWRKNFANRASKYQEEGSLNEHEPMRTIKLGAMGIAQDTCKLKHTSHRTNTTIETNGAFAKHQATAKPTRGSCFDTTAKQQLGAYC